MRLILRIIVFLAAVLLNSAIFAQGFFEQEPYDPIENINRTTHEFNKGLDRYYGLLDLAEKHGIFEKVSTRYQLPDGSKVFGKTINENPEKFFTEDVMEQLESAAQKEFSYGTNPEEIQDEAES